MLLYVCSNIIILIFIILVEFNIISYCMHACVLSNASLQYISSLCYVNSRIDDIKLFAQSL